MVEQRGAQKKSAGLPRPASAPGGGDRRPAGRRRGSDARNRAIAERLAAAKKKSALEGSLTAMTGGLTHSNSDRPLAHRHHIVMGDRIGLDLDLEA